MRFRFALLFAALVSLGWGCAYYNTFFTAKKHFAEARAQTQATATKEPPATALSLYDKCMEQCAKVITNYPKSRWVDDAILLIGRSYYEKKNYTAAIEKAHELMNNFPKSNLVPDANLLLIRSHLAKKEYDDASKIAAGLARIRGDKELSEKAQFLFAEARFEAKDYRGSLEAYRTLVREWKKGKRVDEARFRIGDVYTKLAVYDSALFAYREAAARSRTSDADFRSRQKIGESLDAAGKHEEALRTYQSLLDSFQSDLEGIRIQENPNPSAGLLSASNPNPNPTTPGLGETDTLGLEDPIPGRPPGAPNNQPQTAQNRLPYQQPLVPGHRDVPRVALLAALDLAELRRTEEAIRALKQLVIAFPSTPEAIEAQFRIGFLYEMDMEDFARAREAYDRVASLGASAFREQAAARSQDLMRLSSAKEGVRDSTAVSIAALERDAEKAFLLAEFYLFQQERPDRAMEQYETVERDFPRSRFAGKAAFARAWLTGNLLLAPDQARTLYQRVVDLYPKTAYSERALAILEGEAGKARADSLRIARYTAIRDSVNAAEAARLQADSLAKLEGKSTGALGDSLAAPGPASADSAGAGASGLHRPAPRDSIPVPRPAPDPFRGAPMDTIRTPPDTTGAPADTTGGGEEAPPDSTGDPKSQSPPDSTRTGGTARSTPPRSGRD